jgi:hypothetical protein
MEQENNKKEQKGQFQMLYRETLASLNEERDKRREAAVATRTELQNAREEKEDAKEEAAMLRAELDVVKLRAAELDRAYHNDLRIEKEKEEQLEKELAALKNDGLWQEKLRGLEGQVCDENKKGSFSFFLLSSDCAASHCRGGGFASRTSGTSRSGQIASHRQTNCCHGRQLQTHDKARRL